MEDLLRAALDLKFALIAWETRWRNKTAMTTTIVRAASQMLAGYAEDRVFHGTVAGLGTAAAWRSASDAAEDAIVTGPISRVTAAVARISLLDDRELREASMALTKALATLMTSYGGKPTSAARVEADKELNKASARLGEAARAYDGRLRRRKG